MADEKKTVDEVEKAEDRTGDALEKFEKEASKMFVDLTTACSTLEERLTRRVEQRAVEQSRIMQSYEDRMSVLEASRKASVEARANMLDELRDLREAQRSLGKSLVEYSGKVTDALAECRKLSDATGPLLAKRLEALASQVAELCGMGRRLAAAEEAAKAATEATTKDNLDRLLHERAIRDLRTEVAKLAKDLKPPKPKAEAEVKAS